MRKLLVWLLAGALAVSLCACGGEKTPSGPSEEDLKNTAGNLYLAEVALDSAASLVLEHWSTSSYTMEKYFSTEDSELDGAAKSTYDFRAYAKERIDEAKALLGTESNGEFYDAAKTYYLAIQDYHSLLANYPNGYSKLTYSSAISECRSACRSAFNELTFYTSVEQDAAEQESAA